MHRQGRIQTENKTLDTERCESIDALYINKNSSRLTNLAKVTGQTREVTNPNQLLESNYAHQYTSIVVSSTVLQKGKISYQSSFKNRIRRKVKRSAMAGNLIRISCLEGNYAHHYTTMSVELLQRGTEMSVLHVN